MKLRDILNKLDIRYNFDGPDTEIKIENLCMDSRVENKNGVFFCISGLRFDSHKFIDQAIENGAKVIVHDKKVSEYKELHKDIAFIEVNDSRLALAKFAEILNDYPSKNLTVYGVTGTNGKTSISYLIYKVLSNFEKSAYNGTAGTLIDGEKAPYTYLTTPNTLDLVNIFKMAKNKRCKSIAIEVSSHALDMKRTAGIDFDIAIYTNLSRDHLDYHGSMQAYRDAKAELFRNLKQDGIAVINEDDSESEFFKNASGSSKRVSYGKSELADYRFDNIKLSPNGTEFDLFFEGRKYSIKTNLISEINVYNLTAVIASVHSSGKNLKDIISMVKNVDFNIGRFQYVESSKYSVIVDFAHTPDAMEKVFNFSDLFRKDGLRVISVFGSAGERDKGKRPIMGEIADKHCDLIILTEDDNRSESPLQIAKEISEGIKNKEKFLIEIDREKAIKLAFEKANKGDLILLLGKAVDRIIYRDGYIEEYEGDDMIAQKYSEI